MKKILWTLCVDNYEPEITAITFPFMKAYAKKIGAEFRIIDQRKFPQHPPVFEKFQLWDLAREAGADWNIFFDADSMIHPEFFDVTALIGKDTTASWGSDFTPIRFKPDKYFLRDGRFQGKGNWCAIVSDWCLDYWHPLEDITVEEAIQNITPTLGELTTVVTPSHLIDDYIVSRNIARFGLKHKLIQDIYKERNLPNFFLYHQYTVPGEKKVKLLESVAQQWGVKK